MSKKQPNAPGTPPATLDELAGWVRQADSRITALETSQRLDAQAFQALGQDFQALKERVAKLEDAPIPQPQPQPQPTGLNVKTKGVKGDGSTNDAPALQALLSDAALPSLYFPAGSYLLGSTLQLKRPVTLAGDGPGSVLIHGGGTALEATGASGLVVRSLGFRGSVGKTMTDGNWGRALHLIACKGAVVEACEFNWPGYGVYHTGVSGVSSGSKITGCKFNGWGAVAVFCNGGEQITNCQMLQLDTAINEERSSHGIYIHSGCADILVQDTLIKNARKYGCQLYGQDVGTFIDRVTFRRVTFEACNYGLTLTPGAQAAGKARDVVIDACRFLSNQNGALSIKGGERVTVTAPEITGGKKGMEIGVWGAWPGTPISELSITDPKITGTTLGVWAIAQPAAPINGRLVRPVFTNVAQPLDIAAAPGLVVQT